MLIQFCSGDPLSKFQTGYGYYGGIIYYKTFYYNYSSLATCVSVFNNSPGQRHDAAVPAIIKKEVLQPGVPALRDNSSYKS